MHTFVVLAYKESSYLEECIFAFYGVKIDQISDQTDKDQYKEGRYKS